MFLAKNDDVSGKSSPSREVEKILNEVETYETYFDPDNLIINKLQHNGSAENKIDFKTTKAGTYCLNDFGQETLKQLIIMIEFSFVVS